MKNEFGGERPESGAEEMEQDLIFSTAREVIKHMEQLEVKKDKLSDIVEINIMEDALKQARLESQDLLLQMAGAIDEFKATQMVSEDVISGIAGKIVSIEGILNEVDNPQEEEGSNKIAA